MADATGRSQTAREVFDAKHPGCCPRCGWHLSSHGHSHGHQSDCPNGVSPAQQDGTLRALSAAASGRRTS